MKQHRPWAVNPFVAVLRVLEVIAILIYLIIEEVLWVRIGEPIYTRLKNIKLLQRFQHYVETEINEWLLFFIFLVPFILMELLGILSGKMFVTGRFGWGILLYLLKGLSTSLVVYLFNIGKQKLLRFKIVDWFYQLILWMKASAIYQSVMAKIVAMKTALKHFFARFKGQRGIFSKLAENTRKTYTKLKALLKRPL